MDKPKKSLRKPNPPPAVKIDAPPGQGWHRPESYKPEFADLAYRLMLLRHTDDELAGFFGIDKKTIYNWDAAHPEFRERRLAGKDVADGAVVESLFARANGYSHPDIDIRVVDGAIVQTEIIKHYPPDTAAATYILNNRHPDKWAHTVKQQVTGKDGGAIQVEDARKPIGDYLAEFAVVKQVEGS